MAAPPFPQEGGGGLENVMYTHSISLDFPIVVQTQGSRPGQCDETLSHALLDKFVEAGGNFIDTADVYQFGVSETIIGT